jgi:hypothetical protein
MTASDDEIAGLRKRLRELEAKKLAPTRGRAVPLPGWVLALGVLVMAGWPALFFLTSHQTEAPPPPASPAPSVPCDEAWAKAEYIKAQAYGIVRAADVARGEGVVVMVSPARWRAQSFRGQQTLAAAIDCAVAGNGNHLTALRFRGDRSGADLYALTGPDLLRLREEGLGMGSGKH